MRPKVKTGRGLLTDCMVQYDVGHFFGQFFYFALVFLIATIEIVKNFHIKH